MDTKTIPIYMLLQETHLRLKDTYKLKVKGWKKMFHASGNEKRSGVAVLISDKIDFKTKSLVRDKGGHYIMINEQSKEGI